MISYLMYDDDDDVKQRLGPQARGEGRVMLHMRENLMRRRRLDNASRLRFLPLTTPQTEAVGELVSPMTWGDSASVSVRLLFGGIFASIDRDGPGV